MEQLQYSQSGSILQALFVFYLCFPYTLNLHLFLTILCIDVVDDVESLQDMSVYDKPDGDRLHQQPHSGKSQPHSGHPYRLEQSVVTRDIKSKYRGKYSLYNYPTCDACDKCSQNQSFKRPLSSKTMLMFWCIKYDWPLPSSMGLPMSFWLDIPVSLITGTLIIYKHCAIGLR